MISANHAPRLNIRLNLRRVERPLFCTLCRLESIHISGVFLSKTSRPSIYVRSS